MTPAEREWIERFGLHLRNERRMSGHTVAAYRRDLTELAAFCERRAIAGWTAVEHAHLRTFAAAGHAGGIAPRSIQRRLSAVRTFYEFLVREGRCAGIHPRIARRALASISQGRLRYQSPRINGPERNAGANSRVHGRVQLSLVINSV